MDTEQSYSLLLKGGHVIDPANDLDAPMDVAIDNGHIAAVAADIDPVRAKRVIDVSGFYVTPGLIDMHVHLHPDYYFGGIVADAHSWSSGITTFVDAGSAGGATFGDFKERVIDKYKTRIFAYLNIVDWGMRGECEQEVRRMNPLIAANVAQAYPDLIVGIKVAHYWTWQPYDAEHGPWDSVDRGVEAARLCGKPVMVDFWPRPERTYADLILKKLGPGDIHTHVFAQQFPIITEKGKVNDILFQARERGVIFDVGHGGGSFWFRNAVPAVEQGFLPDSISTDLHIGNAANGLVTNLLNVMSKFLNIGLSLREVIARATVAPAREIGHPELGTLTVGGPADVAVLHVREGKFGFIDCGRAKLTGNKKLECVLTVQEGQIRYDPNGLSMPEWEDAPDSYWVCRSPSGATSSWRPPRGVIHPR
ncbi:MAG: amidohydrolase/deacetylase family metallohydrolase [Chloroflexi bacterium]|nr:amidohydrolase/deacetylase family metallohydrolase [Chloroflexota bacterium]